MSMNGKHQAGGFTLLEVLITMVLVSVGLLGLSLMQATGVHFTKTSYSHTPAVMLASDITDRIRANSANIATYVGGGTNTITPTTIATTVPCAPPTVCGTATAIARRI